MPRIPVKCLSVNQAFSGRHFKTPAYHTYEQEVLYLLPKNLKIPDGKLTVSITFGVSNKGADVDNPTKTFLDLLSKAYKFNDNLIYLVSSHKEITKKGKEFIEFTIESYPTTHDFRKLLVN